MEKQKPLTVITGFSLKDKCDVIRRVQAVKQSKLEVILFRPTDIKLVINSEDPFPLTPFISEVVHHLEINTLTNLITALKEESCNEHIDEIILDIYPISDLHFLLESLTSQTENQNWFIKSHIHVIDVKDFWFSYFSEHRIDISELDSNHTLEYTFGETLINQLELADSIYLSNTDQLSHERLGELMVFIQNLQPNAWISGMNDRNWKSEDKKTAFDIKAAYHLYVDQINLFTSRSNMKVIGQYGIETFVYQSFFPVDFSRLEHFFTKLPSEVFRMKGRCFNPFTQELYSISQVGSSIQVDTTNMHSPPKPLNVLTELLFIGSEMNQQAIEMMLNDCLQIKYDNMIAY